MVKQAVRNVYLFFFLGIRKISLHCVCYFHWFKFHSSLNKRNFWRYIVIRKTIIFWYSCVYEYLLKSGAKNSKSLCELSYTILHY